MNFVNLIKELWEAYFKNKESNSKEIWYKNIITTEFNIVNNTAYYQNKFDIPKFGVAIPINSYIFKDNYDLPDYSEKYVLIINKQNKRKAYAKVVDVGPWTVSDYDYIVSGDRPYAEKFKNFAIPKYINKFMLKESYKRKDIHTIKSNGAGLDLTNPLMEYLVDNYIENKTTIETDWKFVDYNDIPNIWKNRLSKKLYKK